MHVFLEFWCPKRNIIRAKHKLLSMPKKKLVDVIFLDIDGVLLPFGDDADGRSSSYSSSYSSISDQRRTEGCIFPDRTMEALTTLLMHLDDDATSRREKEGAKKKKNGGDDDDDASSSDHHHRAELVLSSSWRSRPDFVEDILSSFRAYATTSGGGRRKEDAANVMRVWESRIDSFFDITDPNYHATRHDEIYNWVRQSSSRKGNKISKANATTTTKEGGGGLGGYIIRSWIALDDEDLVNVEGRIVPDANGHAVKTDSSIGLTHADVRRGIRLMEEQIREYHSTTTATKGRS